MHSTHNILLKDDPLYLDLNTVIYNPNSLFPAFNSINIEEIFKPYYEAHVIKFATGLTVSPDSHPSKGGHRLYPMPLAAHLGLRVGRRAITLRMGQEAQAIRLGRPSTRKQALTP
jgi:hypothetical protein